ncbi:hypothetical protein M407DRAFT_31692 [Tulasnella calospora MUT 4182]|uniref:Uncharacterized protein n=1 Tax=Tulasnella calospora MUT 4182 TaxID=1051891 RepID=A0A0C3LAW9_9AGAM|nr:hypothetical protein M407DRAFT_31692 [Tulasnella calospora MUT 4182]
MRKIALLTTIVASFGAVAHAGALLWGQCGTAHDQSITKVSATRGYATIGASYVKDGLVD